MSHSPLALLRRAASHRRAVKLTAAAGALAVVGGLVVAMSAPADGAAAAAPTTCSDATLQGTYLFAASGWQYTGGTTPVANAYAGSEHFGGAGTLTGVANFSSGGAISPRTTYTGTYTLNADCTGIMFNSVGGDFAIYVAPSGKSFTYLETVGTMVFSVTENRVSKS